MPRMTAPMESHQSRAADPSYGTAFPPVERELVKSDKQQTLVVDLANLEGAFTRLEEEVTMMRDALEPISLPQEPAETKNADMPAPSRSMSNLALRVLEVTRRTNQAVYALRAIRTHTDLPEVEPPF